MYILGEIPKFAKVYKDIFIVEPHSNLHILVLICNLLKDFLKEGEN